MRERIRNRMKIERVTIDFEIPKKYAEKILTIIEKEFEKARQTIQELYRSASDMESVVTYEVNVYDPLSVFKNKLKKAIEKGDK